MTEAFTGTNGVQIENLNGKWALNTPGSLDIAANTLAPDGGEPAARWIANPFYANQYAQAVLSNLTGGITKIGVAVRLATDGSESYYGFYSSNAVATLFKLVAGEYTNLQDVAAVSIGATMRIEANGTTIRALANGVEVCSVTDASLAAGSAGVCGSGDASANRIDTWEGGNICP